ncbi:hypothetical protein [Kribbella sp. HUAS MG21]|uniref:Uncharacterized protein n=1 Tax=Kribbella sp. HUAS MG21 TaxID=3160966 RepID=A0AAU7TCT9_9ACTN
MTAPLDLRRAPARPAVGNLFRVTAGVSLLSIPLLWVAHLLVPARAIPCQDHPCPPSLDVIRDPEPIDAVLAAVGVELVVILGYLVLAAARRTLDLRTGLRWLPVAVVIVVLAVGSFGWLLEAGAGRSYDASELTFLILLGAWVLMPLILYVVHRADPRAVVPVIIGLAPTALGNALLINNDPLVVPMALPAIMLVVGVITVLVMRRRR